MGRKGICEQVTKSAADSTKQQHRSTSSCAREGTGQRWGAGLHPASQPRCSHQHLLEPPKKHGWQVHMSSADHLCSGGTVCLCVCGAAQGCGGCPLFLEWDGPRAKAPGEPEYEPSNQMRPLKLRGLGHVPQVLQLPSEEPQTYTQACQPPKPTAHSPQPHLPGAGVSPEASLALSQLVATTHPRSGCECTVLCGEEAA